MKRFVWLTALSSWALAQFGPLPGMGQPQGPGGGQVYQNPALGLVFPVPQGFQLAQELPQQGGMVVLFVSPMGAELYAFSQALPGPMDLQAFHQYNLQLLAQRDQNLAAQGGQATRQPLSGLTLAGRPAMGVYSQILFQGQQYLDLAVYTVEGNRAYAFQLTTPAQVFPQVQPLFQQVLAQARIAQGGPAPFPPSPSPSPLPPGPGPMPPGPGGAPIPPTLPGGGEHQATPPIAPPPPSPGGGSPRAQPPFTPPANRVVELRYGRERGDGQRYAVAVGGLYYRIEPAGNGRWKVTEVVQDEEGKEESAFLLDPLGLQDGEDVLLPPVWHTGRTEIGGSRFTRAKQGNLTVYRYQDEEIRVEFAYRPDGWLAYLIYCDLSRKQNPCTRYALLEVR
ncbi:hypothetical protein TJA_23380 [Thermus sp. LT1-2-5]|uniref:hypothetical protein n=1 Tax=Thermus sp. LT1-2-5 TaxID=3026935 RepID=UPI0030E94007